MLTSTLLPKRADGYVLSERYGAQSAFLELAPRAIVLCASDSACAAALFARYVEATRPDVEVLPAQHIWDCKLVQRLGSRAAQSRVGCGPLTAAARNLQAQRVLAALATGPANQPIYFESALSLTAARDAVRLWRLERAPWLEAPTSVGNAPEADPEQIAQRMQALERARFGRSGPRTALARQLWSSAHAEVGTAYLQRGENQPALSQLQRAEQLTPERAIVHSNLGVAFEDRGDFADALRETRLAIQLDPRRTTPWVNLTRLMLRMNGRQAALWVLAQSRSQGLQDARLAQLQRKLETDHGTTTK
jgi:Flp pilus assembly protein TadD